MSYPILYSSTETEFDHNGLGILGDCVSYRVVSEGNGAYDLTMLYPMDGIHFEEITDRSIIKGKFDKFIEPQLFRVKTISKAMSGNATVYAEHISYDLSGIPVKPFTADSVTVALAGLRNNAVVDCPFEFWTDKATIGKFIVTTPASIRSRLGGVAGSILDVYGGEYEFDNYIVKLHNNRGMNRGVSIRYGKNLMDIQQEQNFASVATGVYPYWAGDVDGNTVLVELPEKIVNAPGTYNFVKIRTLDLSSEFETQPTVEQLRTKSENYIKSNNIGIPDVSMTVSFVQLSQYAEYKNLELLERISLFDSVNVEFPDFCVSTTAKVVKIVYDGLTNRIESITLGSVRANIADTIANQGVELEKAKEKPSVSMVQKISSSLAKAIMGASGGAVRVIDTNGDGEPDELYIADNHDPLQSVKVWRFNYNGWAASKNGYSGPFEFGATLADGLLANFVTAAQLVAGTIKSRDGKTFLLDLDNGILNMNATSLAIAGKSVDEIAQDKVDAQTQADVFNKLTNNGTLPGLFMKNGQLYINASYLSSGVITSSDGTVKIDLKNNSFVVDSTGSIKRRVQISSGEIVGFGADLTDGSLYRALTIVMGYKQEGSTALTTISGAGGGLSIQAGTVDGLLRIGDTYAGNVFISGKSLKIKPGKTTLFTGSVSQNGTASVSNTADFDLFAVYLGDGTTVEGTAVLCYKTGSDVRGIGGRAGTSSTYRQLHFFEATISGNTWTVKDAKKQSVYDGSLASSESMKLMKVVGVI